MPEESPSSAEIPQSFSIEGPLSINEANLEAVTTLISDERRANLQALENEESKNDTAEYSDLDEGLSLTMIANTIEIVDGGDDGFVHFARVKGQVVGASLLKLKKVQTGNLVDSDNILVVSRNHRRRGIARELIAAQFEELRKRDIKQFTSYPRPAVENIYRQLGATIEVEENELGKRWIIAMPEIS